MLEEAPTIVSLPGWNKLRSSLLVNLRELGPIVATKIASIKEGTYIVPVADIASQIPIPLLPQQSSTMAGPLSLLRDITNNVAEPSIDAGSKTFSFTPSFVPMMRKAEIGPDGCQISKHRKRLNNQQVTCGSIRKRIKEFIETGQMKTYEFQAAIGTNSDTYYTFMKDTGESRSKSLIYLNAYYFFRHRETNSIQDKPVKAAKKKAAEEVDKPEDNEKAAEALDTLDIELEGEEDDEGEVYDTCDVAREKIRAFLRASPLVTQARFCREISKTFRNGKKLSQAVLKIFLGKTGPTEGNVSTAFYASYVFFEKLRMRYVLPPSYSRT